GTVELLTREGEIEIAKRIEEGLRHMIQAIAACPTTIDEILALSDKVKHEEMRIEELVDGLIDPNAEEEAVPQPAIVNRAAAANAAKDKDKDADGESDGEDSDEDDADDGAAAIAANLLQLKEDSLEIFQRIHKLNDKM